MKTRLHSKTASVAWPAALALAALGGTLATACMMPFAALAVLSVASMTWRRAGLTISAAWAANQAIGFFALGLPATSYTFGWGVALGVASLAAGLVAKVVLRGGREFAVIPMLAALGASFAAYETLLFGFALVVGGTDTFTPTIIARLLLNEATWFAALSGLYVVLTRGAPRWFGPAPKFRVA